MFPKEIRIEHENDIPSGTTGVDPDKTEMEIRRLLEKFGVKRYWWISEPDGKQIVFELETKPYIFRIPRVLVKKGKGYNRKFIPDEKIGIRIVYYFLKTFVPFITSKALDADKLLLGARMIYDKEGGMVPLADHVDAVIERSGSYAAIPAISSAIPSDSKLLNNRNGHIIER
jgi:hypothetical protein